MIQKKGNLVAIEGIDGSGKSTLIRGLDAYFKECNIPILITKEPGGTSFGAVLRSILQKKEHPVCALAEFFLFAADRAQHFYEIIMPALEKGCLIISDRMADSSYVYQGVVKGIDCTKIEQASLWAMNGKRPDLVIYVRITPEVAARRVKERNLPLTSFEQEKRDFFERAVEGFDQLYAERQDVLILDGQKSTEELLREAASVIKAKFLLR